VGSVSEIVGLWARLKWGAMAGFSGRDVSAGRPNEF